jgi:hypothetical protein
MVRYTCCVSDARHNSSLLLHLLLLLSLLLSLLLLLLFAVAAAAAGCCCYCCCCCLKLRWSVTLLLGVAGMARAMAFQSIRKDPSNVRTHTSFAP